MVNLCLTLAECSVATLVEKITQYNGQVPYVEVRLDYLSKMEVPVIPSYQGTEFIATCRPQREGGLYEGSEKDRLDFLARAAHAGFSWLDLEHDVQEVPDLPSVTKVVRSYHCFDSFCPDLTFRFHELERMGGDLIKLATSVNQTAELRVLLKWMESLSSQTPFVILGMGELGQTSRFLGGLIGNFWTYVAETEDSNVAPGQFTLQQAEECYGLSEREDPPGIYGVLGNPVKHSLSPLIHNTLFRHYQLNNIYFPLALDQINPWFEYIDQSRLPFKGFSVTLPFKVDVFKYLNTKDSPVDALNTLVKRGPNWVGLNTDYHGFLYPLKSYLSLEGKKAVVLGNGGVAHTVVQALKDEGVEVVVVGRNSNKVAFFAKQYNCRWALFSDLPISADLCVNATPVGQHPNVDESPLREDELEFELIYDLIYRPRKTHLLELAKNKGLRTISGVDMFIEQAALQFTTWTGIDPERNMIREMVSTISDFQR